MVISVSIMLVVGTDILTNFELVFRNFRNQKDIFRIRWVFLKVYGHVFVIHQLGEWWTLEVKILIGKWYWKIFGVFARKRYFRSRKVR